LFVAAVLGDVAWMLTGLRSADGFVPFNDLTLATGFLVGPLTFFVANLAASRDRRAHAQSWSATLPVEPRRRTAALCLAVLRGPFLIAAGAVGAVQICYWVAQVDIARYPDLAEFLTGPLAVLGGGLLGVMVARWAPWPGAAALVMIALAAATLVLTATARTEWFAPYLELTRYSDGRFYAFTPGSAAWHAMYLLCLSGMAAVGALLGTPGPKRALLALGGGLALGAMACGWLQLP
jgi:hypothetical protein